MGVAYKNISLAACRHSSGRKSRAREVKSSTRQHPWVSTLIKRVELRSLAHEHWHIIDLVIHYIEQVKKTISHNHLLSMRVGANLIKVPKAYWTRRQAKSLNAHGVSTAANTAHIYSCPPAHCALLRTQSAGSPRTDIYDVDIHKILTTRTAMAISISVEIVAGVAEFIAADLAVIIPHTGNAARIACKTLPLLAQVLRWRTHSECTGNLLESPVAAILIH